MDGGSQTKLRVLTTILIFIAIIFANASWQRNIGVQIKVIYFAFSVILAGTGLILTFKYHLYNKIFSGLMFLCLVGYSFWRIL